ncbi:MAG: galactokinase family protein [Candidatus Binatia bacterium]|nr:galactokinase family protein [Candidatus Binatia bacterium]
MTLSLEERVERLRQRLRDETEIGAGEANVVVSPYRICPIGAHVDHQGGPVLGTAIDAGTLLAFAPSGSSACRLQSTNFEGQYETDLTTTKSAPEGWGRYFWAAAATLGTRTPAPLRGIVGRVEGSLPGGGLSSSASVVLAYLTAIAHENGIELSPQELVNFARQAENEYVGVKCGILDPACIVASKRDHLVSIDTLQCEFEPIPGEKAASQSTFLVAFSGVDRNLRHTGFNDRVDQCHEAARHLGQLCGNAAAEKLGDHIDAVFEEHLDALPSTLQKRARHFFEERHRVRAGVETWRNGDLEGFGRLMSDSCRSSIENFEVGSPEIGALHELICRTPGVYGARFSGAGFGGCVVGLVAADRAQECLERIEREYRRLAPELTSAYVFLAQSRDGLNVR